MAPTPVRLLLLRVSIVLACALVTHDAMMTSAGASHPLPMVAPAGPADSSHHDSGRIEANGSKPGSPGSSSDCGVVREAVAPKPAPSSTQGGPTDIASLSHSSERAVREDQASSYPVPTQPPRRRRALLQIFIV